MSEVLQFIKDVGLGVSLAVGSAALVYFLFKWITGKLSTQIDNNHQQVMNNIRTQYEKIDELTAQIRELREKLL